MARKTRLSILNAKRGSQAKFVKPSCPENRLNVETVLPVPQTDTGRRGEYPKASERTFVKELGNMYP
jgi:hypothetical protein